MAAADSGLRAISFEQETAAELGGEAGAIEAVAETGVELGGAETAVAVQTRRKVCGLGCVTKTPSFIKA